VPFVRIENMQAQAAARPKEHECRWIDDSK
jgi:hypothetical protein